MPDRTTPWGGAPWIPRIEEPRMGRAPAPKPRQQPKPFTPKPRKPISKPLPKMWGEPAREGLPEAVVRGEQPVQGEIIGPFEPLPLRLAAPWVGREAAARGAMLGGGGAARQMEVMLRQSRIQRAALEDILTNAPPGTEDLVNRIEEIREEIWDQIKLADQPIISPGIPWEAMFAQIAFSKVSPGREMPGGLNKELSEIVDELRRKLFEHRLEEFPEVFPMFLDWRESELEAGRIPDKSFNEWVETNPWAQDILRQKREGELEEVEAGLRRHKPARWVPIRQRA